MTDLTNKKMHCAPIRAAFVMLALACGLACAILLLPCDSPAFANQDDANPLAAVTVAPGAVSQDSPESPLRAQAGTVIASGYCGDDTEGDGTNISWTLYGDYSLVLEGTGEMDFYNETDSFWGFSSPVPGWYEYREMITSVTVGEGIENLGSAVFAHTAITSFTCPSSLKAIDQIAFKGCANLTSITLNEGLETIGSNAFSNSGLTTLHIPKTVKSIEPSVFTSGMTTQGYETGIDLCNVTIDPQNPYLKIQGGALYSGNMDTIYVVSESLNSLFVVPSTVKTIHRTSFQGSNITGIAFPEGLEKIGDYAFNLSKVKSVVFPNSLTTVEWGAFQANYELESAKFGTGLTEVPDRLFWGSSKLTSVEFNGNIQSIGERAFADTGLTEITIPNTVTSIGEYAFNGTNLTRVVIPNSVKSIGVDAFPSGCEVIVPTSLVKQADGSYVDSSLVVTLSYDVTYGQTAARGMLALLNDFRTGGDTWYWNSDDTTKSWATGLSPLAYDYSLERTAMKRAAELPALFSHTRPDGSDCFTAFEGTYSWQGENIAVGYSSAEAVMEAWKEANENYEGQGHRRNMLSDGYNAVGIGHVVCNGVHYWVQDFGYTDSIDSAQTSASEATEAYSLIVPKASIISCSSIGTEARELSLKDKGSSASAPSLTAYDIQFDAGDSSESASLRKASMDNLWQVKDESVATLQGESVVAVSSRGETELVASIAGKEATVPVYVGGRPLTGATIAPIDYQVYDGTEKKPAVTVTLNGQKLVQGTDYMVSYANNTAVGTATATVTGTGGYFGTVSSTFAIVNASETVWRLYDTHTGEHHYTKDANERRVLLSRGNWNDEGTAWVTPKESSTPVYRVYDLWTGEHHYTSDKHEQEVLVGSKRWRDEGIAWYSDDAKTCKVFRVERHDRGPLEHHHYTINENERNVCVGSWGWNDEGVGWYALSAE